VVECTALEMRHRCKPIGGSNPSLSASPEQLRGNPTKQGVFAKERRFLIFLKATSVALSRRCSRRFARSIETLTAQSVDLYTFSLRNPQLANFKSGMVRGGNRVAGLCR
jgi:hypothetical protein